MKKITNKAIYILIFVFILSVSLCLFISCKGKTGSSESQVESTSTVQILNKTTLDMQVGESYLLKVNGSNPTFESSNKLVLTVDENGVLTAVGLGKSTVTVTVDGKQERCEVTVTASVTVPTLTVNSKNLSLFVGDEYQLSPSVYFDGGLITASINYESDNTQVVEVDKNGKITAISMGDAVVSIDWSALGYSDSTKIAISVNPNLVMELDCYEVELVARRKTASSTNATTKAVAVVGVYVDEEEVENPEIVWTSESPSIATVENGVITAVGKGETTVIATYTSGKTTIQGAIYVRVLEECVYTMRYMLRMPNSSFVCMESLECSNVEGALVNAEIKDFAGYELDVSKSETSITLDSSKDLNMDLYYETDEINFVSIQSLSKLGGNNTKYGIWSKKDMTGEYAKDARDGTMFMEKTEATAYSGFRFTYAKENVGGYLLINVYYTAMGSWDGLQIWTSANNIDTDTYLVGVFDENLNEVAREKDKLVGRWVTYVFYLKPENFPLNGGMGGQGAGAYKFDLSFCHGQANSFFMSDFCYITQEQYDRYFTNRV